jgi:O-antigen/teichoic acid export membrane protein
MRLVPATLGRPGSPLTRIAHMTTALAGSDLLRGAMGLATSLVIARGLGRDDFGRWTLCMAWTSTLIGSFDLGFGVLLTREAARGDVGPLLSGALTTRLALFLPVGLLLYWTGSLMGLGNVSAETTHLAVSLTAVGIAYGCLAAVYRASPRRLVAVLTIETIGVAARCAGAFLLVARGATISELLRLAVGVQIAQLVAAFTLWRVIAPHDRFEWPSPRSAWTLLKRAIPFAFAGLVSNAQARVAPLMLGYFSNAGEIASFGVASRIGRAARMLPQAALTAGMPVFAHELQSGGSQSARPKFAGLLRAFATVAAGGLVLFALPIVRLTYGSMFVDAATPLAWIGIGLLPWVANNGRKMHLYASGRERVAVRWSAIALGIQTLGCIILSPRFGAQGAVIALAIGEAFVWWPLRAEEMGPAASVASNVEYAS